MTIPQFKALVVDDDPIARRTVGYALGQENFSCAYAANGTDAMARLSGECFDLVVTDLRMPHKHGHQLATELLAGQQVPVIVVHSSIDDPRLTKDLMQRGVDVNIPVARRAAPLVSERLFVTVPLSYRQARVVYLDDDPIRVDILEERVRQALLNKSGKEVFLRGDGGVQLQDLIDVMDRLKNAGVEKVGIVARLPGER